VNDLLPPAIATTRTRLLELIEQENLALARLGVTAQAITDGITQDAKDLGDAILAGNPEPGPFHETTARAEHAEAVRRAEGTQQAVHAARREFWTAMVDTNCTATVEAVEALAEATIAPVAELLDQAVTIIGKYRSMRTTANILATFPAVPVPNFVDMQDLHRGLGAVAEQIEAIGPQYDIVEARTPDNDPAAA
jgi:hypothetical protein